MGSSGLEPPTSRLSGVRSNLLSYEPTFLRGGDERNRTADPLLARQVLSQLSYTPIRLEAPLSKTYSVEDYSLPFLPLSFRLRLQPRSRFGCYTLERR